MVGVSEKAGWLLRVRWVPLPVSLLPLLLPRLVLLWFRPLDTRPGMRPLSGVSSHSCAASMFSSRRDGKPPPDSASSWQRGSCRDNPADGGTRLTLKRAHLVIRVPVRRGHGSPHFAGHARRLLHARLQHVHLAS